MTSSIVAIAGNNGTVSTINCDTLVATNLPAASKGWDIHSIALLGEDDIWVGLDGDGRGVGTKPFLEHWDGTAWTAHEVSGVVAHPDHRGYDVGSILYISATEAYATVDSNGWSVRHLLKWNGISWSVIASPPFIGRGGQINRDSTATDLWFAPAGVDLNTNVAHWDGSTLDEGGVVPPGDAFSSISGLATYNGKICINAANASSVVYRRDSVGVWTPEFTIASGSAEVINAEGGTNLWVDPVNGDLWVVATVSGTDGLVKWDGVSQTFESFGGSSSIKDIVGVEIPGDKFQIWCPDGIDSALYRDEDTSVWSTILTTVAQPRVAAAFQGDTNTPPYIADASPASGDSSLQPDVSVAVSVVDDDSNLQLSATRIYLNDTLAWSGGTQLSGFSESLETVVNPDGYRFGITPADPFEPGVQTVRVVASDGIASIDESYSFTTVARVEGSDEEPASETEPTGVDLLLGEINRDISVDSGDLPLVAGADEVAQHLRVGLRLYRGEWFLEPESGIPYYQYVMVSAPNSRVIEGIFRQDILGDTDIEELSLFEMNLDPGARALEIEFTAKSSIGPVEVSSVFP